MITTIEDRLKDHLPHIWGPAVNCYKKYKHENWYDYAEDGELLGFITYFFLAGKSDMIITAAKNDRYSKDHWRILRDTLIHRTKPIRIESDKDNNVLIRGAKKFGGFFLGTEIVMPYPWSTGKYATSK